VKSSEVFGLGVISVSVVVVVKLQFTDQGEIRGREGLEEVVDPCRGVEDEGRALVEKLDGLAVYLLAHEDEGTKGV